MAGGGNVIGVYESTCTHPLPTNVRTFIVVMQYRDEPPMATQIHAESHDIRLGDPVFYSSSALHLEADGRKTQYPRCGFDWEWKPKCMNQ